MNTPANTVLDRFWMWGHDAGMHNGHYNLPAPSRMTAAEGAFYLGLHNLIFVAIGNNPAPPFERLARSFAPMKRVVWSVVGDSSSNRTDVGEVVSLARKFPNITGGIMDDFFLGANDPSGRVARHSSEELTAFKREMTSGPRPLDLWVTLYAHNLDMPLERELGLCDVITYWTWRAEDLQKLEQNIERLQAKVAPHHRKILGCYLWDYGAGAPMQMDMMKFQCERGLAWLQDGTIDGMILLASCICDLGIETVEWTREWIKEVGPIPLKAPKR